MHLEVFLCMVPILCISACLKKKILILFACDILSVRNKLCVQNISSFSNVYDLPVPFTIHLTLFLFLRYPSLLCRLSFCQTFFSLPIVWHSSCSYLPTSLLSVLLNREREGGGGVKEGKQLEWELFLFFQPTAWKLFSIKLLIPRFVRSFPKLSAIVLDDKFNSTNTG